MPKTIVLCNPFGMDVTAFVNNTPLIPQLLRGSLFEPGDTVYTLPYNWQTSDIQNIVDGELMFDAKVNSTAGDILGFGYSQGCQVIDKWLHDHGQSAPVQPTSRLRLLCIANANRRYGGFGYGHAMFDQVAFTGGLPNTLPYNYIDFSRQYDGISDFPTDPAIHAAMESLGAVGSTFNNDTLKAMLDSMAGILTNKAQLAAVMNTAIGIALVHNDYFGVAPGDESNTSHTDPNGAVFMLASPTPVLTLLGERARDDIESCYQRPMPANRPWKQAAVSSSASGWFAEYHSRFSLDLPVKVIGTPQLKFEAGTAAIDVPLAVGAFAAAPRHETTASIDLPLEVQMRLPGEYVYTGATLALGLDVAPAEARAQQFGQVDLTLPVQIIGAGGRGTGAGTVGLALPVTMPSAGSKGLQPFTEINVNRTNQPVPTAAAGAWVTLLGAGGGGGQGFMHASANRGGGGGGGGGARIGGADGHFVPRSAMGPTYSTWRQSTGGTTGADGVNSVFSSGGVTLTAGGGGGGGNGTQTTAGAGGKGGEATAAGATNVVAIDGSWGGDGGPPNAGGAAQGGDNLAGGGPGGGGSGGLSGLGTRGNPGRGGNAPGIAGGAAPSTTGGSGNSGTSSTPVNMPELGGNIYYLPGSGGSGGAWSSANFNSTVGGNGGACAAGGGASSGTNTGTPNSGGTGGRGYSRVAWVAFPPGPHPQFDAATAGAEVGGWYQVPQWLHPVGANALGIVVIESGGPNLGPDAVPAVIFGGVTLPHLFNVHGANPAAGAGWMRVHAGKVPPGSQVVDISWPQVGAAFFGRTFAFTYRDAAITESTYAAGVSTGSATNPASVTLPTEPGDILHGAAQINAGAAPVGTTATIRQQTAAARWFWGGDVAGAAGSATFTVNPSSTQPWNCYGLRLRRENLPT